jgi:hypothetical protein
MSAKTPQEEVTAKIWSRLGTRWGTRVGILLTAIGGLGWLAHSVETFDKIRSWFPGETPVTPDEITCLNEWVLRLAQTGSQQLATQIKADFLSNYQHFGHVNRGNEPIWKNDVHVVRDIQQKDNWLVVIDMYPGASSKQCMEEGKNEMLAVLDAKPEGMAPGNRRDWENRLGRLLRPAEPLCYDFAKFEKVNGKILNQTRDVEYQRGLGSCAGKLRRAPNKVCAE